MSQRIAKLREIADLERDGVAPGDIADGMAYLGLENIEAGGRIISWERVAKGELASAKFRFGPDHLLYGKLRPYLGKIALPECAGICSTDIVPIRPRPDVDRRYLAHFLRQPSMVAYAASRATGINLPRLSPRSLEDFEVPLPSIPTQKRIAAILDHVERIRHRRRETLDCVQEWRLSVFQEIFSAHEAKGSRWSTEALGALSTIVRGSSPRPQGDSRYFGGPIPRLMIADISRDGMLVTPKIDSLTEEGARKSRPMPAGSLVIAVSGAVGLPAILASDACIHDGFVGLRDLSAHIEAEFLYYVLLKMRSTNSAMGTGAIWSNLTTDQIKRIEVPVPPLAVQQEFTNRMTRADELVASQQAHLAALNCLFASLQYRAFRGEL